MFNAENGKDALEQRRDRLPIVGAMPQLEFVHNKERCIPLNGKGRRRNGLSRFGSFEVVVAVILSDGGGGKKNEYLTREFVLSSKLDSGKFPQFLDLRCKLRDLHRRSTQNLYSHFLLLVLF